MNQLVNPSIVLDNHPQGAATTGNFRIANQPIGELKPGEFLIENTWLSQTRLQNARAKKIRIKESPESKTMEETLVSDIV